LAVLHDRVARERSRLAEVTTEIESDALGGLNEEALVKALRDFDGIWNALRGEERVRLVHLLVQRVDYNAESGEVFIHFGHSGLNSFISNNDERYHLPLAFTFKLARGRNGKPRPRSCPPTCRRGPYLASPS
jgi:hypothetical protein